MSSQDITSLVFNILITIGKAIGAIPGVGGSQHYQSMMKSLNRSHEKSKPSEPSETESSAGGPTPDSTPPPDEL